VISNWKVGNDQSEYEIVIPPDTRAVIQLPEKAGDVITESGQPVAKSVEVLGTHRFSVGSGTYRFVLRHQP
jgi:hypothetical protein